MTQASTGQTTGTWLVAFAPDGGAQGALRAALNAVSAASSRAVLSASVDTSTAVGVSKRFFGSSEGERAVILFKNRLMFEYPGSLAPHEGQADELLAFALNPTLSSVGKVVPRPATAIDAALSAAKEALGPILVKFEEIYDEKVASAVEPLLSKIRPHLEKAGVKGSTAAVGGLGATFAAAVAVALAGKKASSAAAGGRRSSSSSSAGKRPVATRQSARRSTTKRA